MSNDLGLGRLIGKEDKVERDAIHIAVVPVFADVSLRAGEHVGLVDGTLDTVSKDASEKIGIVDPFLTTSVPKGKRCWLYLYPGTITSLRHDWTHPSFIKAKEIDKVALSKKWIEEYAESIGLDYDELVSSAADYLTSGDRLNKGDLLDGVYLEDEFWDHYEIVEGTKVKDDDRGSFFSCAC